jgi:putative IMPACT (imprinted ancient) family translation regulator
MRPNSNGAVPPSSGFVTLARRHRAETREKGSRFIATAMPVADEAGARAAIETMRLEFPDATHHCWGYSLEDRRAGAVERSDDAGEPRGTAGPPILVAIRSAGVSNVVVVVTRYFGGTKLGKGGLARAYRGAAALALAEAPRVVAVAMTRLSISVPVDLDGEARHLVARHAGRVESSSYDDVERSVLGVSLPVGALPRLVEALQALCRGQARVEERGPV